MNLKYRLSWYGPDNKRHNRQMEKFSLKANTAFVKKLVDAYATEKQNADAIWKRQSSIVPLCMRGYTFAGADSMSKAISDALEIMEDLYGEKEVKFLYEFI